MPSGWTAPSFFFFDNQEYAQRVAELIEEDAWN